MDLLGIQYGILSAMITSPGCVGEVMARLTAEDFDSLPTRGLFEAIGRLHFSGAPIDQVTVRREAGDDYQAAIDEALRFTATDVPYYCGLLREGVQLRRIQGCAYDLVNAATMEDAGKTVDYLNSLMTLRQEAEIVTAREAAADFIRRMGDKKKPEYLSLGMPELDKLLFIELGDFVLLGGYSSAGKTLLSLQFALALAGRYRVGYFTLETNTKKLTDRLVSHMARIPLSAIKSCGLEGETSRRAAEAVRRLGRMNLDLVSASGMSVRDIQAVTLNRRYQVIFVDYLQIVSAPGKNRYEQVTGISLGLHTLAQSHSVAVFALAQLSRPEKTNGKLQPPTLASFRESGQLEQDADVAMLLRPADPNDNRSNRLLKIAKNKDGPRDEFELSFHGATQTLAITGKAAERNGMDQMGFHDLPNDNSPLPF